MSRSKAFSGSQRGLAGFLNRLLRLVEKALCRWTLHRRLRYSRNIYKALWNEKKWNKAWVQPLISTPGHTSVNTLPPLPPWAEVSSGCRFICSRWELMDSWCTVSPSEWELYPCLSCRVHADVCFNRHLVSQEVSQSLFKCQKLQNEVCCRSAKDVCLEWGRSFQI